MNEKMTRRLCLKYAADVVGIPQSQADLVEYINGRGLDSTFVAKALAYLASAGFLERCEKTAASVPMWKCTAAGARQAAREVPPEQLDPMIWD
jgi:hypothetical protein